MQTFPYFCKWKSDFLNEMTKKSCFSKPRHEQKIRGQGRPFPLITAIRTSTQASSQWSLKVQFKTVGHSSLIFGWYLVERFSVLVNLFSKYCFAFKMNRWFWNLLRGLGGGAYVRDCYKSSVKGFGPYLLQWYHFIFSNTSTLEEAPKVPFLVLYGTYWW